MKVFVDLDQRKKLNYCVWDALDWIDYHIHIDCVVAMTWSPDAIYWANERDKNYWEHRSPKQVNKTHPDLQLMLQFPHNYNLHKKIHGGVIYVLPENLDTSLIPRFLLPLETRYK